ncbi:hypothetical protein AA313_de0203015 [Arthrobotrys entomopaga]|nr:hypothetical protein AA313_de0203015 [Arthrobotrys entomopaga]
MGSSVCRVPRSKGIPLPQIALILLSYLTVLIAAAGQGVTNSNTSYLAENQQWIKDWAARSRQNLANARLERDSMALTEDPENVGWSDEADLVIVSRADWNKFENKLQVGKKGPIHYLLEGGRKFVLITDTAIRLANTIKNAIPKKNIKTDAAIWDVYGAIFTIFTSPLYSRFTTELDPETVAHVKRVMDPPGGFASAYNVKDEVLLAIAKDAQGIIENYSNSKQPLNKGGTLYTPTNTPATVISERVSLTRLFDYNGGTKNDLNEIYINDAAFLYTWQDVFFVYKLCIVFLDYMVDVVDKIWSELAKEMRITDDWFLKSVRVGEFDRRKKGYQYYFDNKYKGNLGFIPPDATVWNSWTDSDKSNFPDMLQDFMHAVSFATRSALPLMMEMFGDIAVQARKLGRKSLIEAPQSFADFDPGIDIDTDMNLLKQYPEIFSNRYIVYKYT